MISESESVLLFAQGNRSCADTLNIIQVRARAQISDQRMNLFIRLEIQKINISHRETRLVYRLLIICKLFV